MSTTLKNVVVASTTCAMMALTVGCGKKKLTFAEVVQVYTGEVTELTRLEAKRASLVAASEGAAALDDLKASRNALGAGIGDLQKSLREATNGLVDEKLTDQADKAVGEKLKELDEQIDGPAKQATKSKAETEKELSELDKQIEQQKARVETARKTKDSLAP